jgi:hypothetical protein
MCSVLYAAAVLPAAAAAVFEFDKRICNSDKIIGDLMHAQVQEYYAAKRSLRTQTPYCMQGLLRQVLKHAGMQALFDSTAIMLHQQ